MEEESISSGSAMPLPQGGGVPALPNFGVSFYLCVHPLTQNYQIWRGNIYGEGLISRGQPLPTPKGRGPSVPNFWSSLLFMCTSFDAELPNLTW